jgi:hypothetical protein
MTFSRRAGRQLAGAQQLGRFEVGYVAEGGVRCQVPLADAGTVRFELMAPVRPFIAWKGQRHLPGCGGRPRLEATWVTSPGWNVIT